MHFGYGPKLPDIPSGTRPIDFIIDFLACPWEYAKDQITCDIGAVADTIDLAAYKIIGQMAHLEIAETYARSGQQFRKRTSSIARPPDADIATLSGAARYGLSKRSLVSTIICPRSYVMEFQPAEQEDWLKLPMYVSFGYYSSFIVALYTSNSDNIMRITDEGEILEPCKWTVDLTSMPTF
ncbi:hypothetical protein EST38_g10899 [Candolleomyces aberdarensis]|uniref:Uncharacterized protein n=1 Tax=Candolleomyces aberdarensis TaxID=2316362 RepID=A0A4Q2D8I6_9AGAR|nr:hypothetical protein EST38_g10899 [Candolleomyces aberdarensis]